MVFYWECRGALMGNLLTIYTLPYIPPLSQSDCRKLICSIIIYILNTEICSNNVPHGDISNDTYNKEQFLIYCSSTLINIFNNNNNNNNNTKEWVYFIDN